MFGPVYWGIHAQNSNVVGQSSSVKLRMNCNAGNVAFNVRVEFHVVVNVPFTQAYAQVIVCVPVRQPC